MSGAKRPGPYPVEMRPPAALGRHSRLLVLATVITHQRPAEARSWGFLNPSDSVIGPTVEHRTWAAQELAA